jgi:hypothetical protein
MGLLSRILKTPDDDTDEVQDEFQAEESGLLMAASPASKEAAVTPPEAGADASLEVTAETAAEAEGVALTAEGEAQGPSQQEEGESPEAANDPGASEPPSEGEPPPSEPPDGSADDPLAAFRSTVGERRHVQGIQDDLVDVSAAELLAEARSIRDALVGANQGPQLLGEAEEEAA